MECPLGNSMIGGRREELPGLADDDMLWDSLEAPGGLPSGAPSASKGRGDVVLGAPDQDDVAHVAGTQKERWLALLAAQRRAHSFSQPWPGRAELIGGQEAEMRQPGGPSFCHWPYFAASGAYTRAAAQCAAQHPKWLQ